MRSVQAPGTDPAVRFAIWMAVGFAIYFIYGYKRSRLALGAEEEAVFKK